jgi:5-methyltetrahydrofolate--homocysteine methyltransferase
MSDRLARLLAERPFLLADGATGTNLFDMGLPTGDAPELWNLEQPDRIGGLHRAMLEAGADIILTNSFGGSRQRLRLHRADQRVGEINEAAAAIARRAADAFTADTGRAVIVAGSMGPTGELFEPLGPLSVEAGTDSFAEQARALAAGGADVLWIETMSSREEVTAALHGAAVTGLPVVSTVSFDTNGRTMMGVTPADYASLCHALIPQPFAYGSNCGVGAAEVVASIVNMRRGAASGDIIVAKGNCGIPYFDEGRIRYDGTPVLMADYARLARDAGARIIGGCCGTTPEHVRAMRAALDTSPAGSEPTMDEIVARLGKVSTGAEAQALGIDSAAGGEGAAGRRRARRRGNEPAA